MKIHPEGFGVILVSIGILILFNLVIYWLAGRTTSYIIMVLSVILLSFIIYFFRNPDRTISPEKGVIYSPADGKIVIIEKAFEKEYFKKEMLKISIFMSVTNVHLNRVPTNGHVVYTKYHPGKYLMAFYPKASELNEHSSVVIETPEHQQYLVRQIAGFLARRIRPYLKEGQAVKAGSELGFIRFGSRVDLFLPPETKIMVKKGEKVSGNYTVIGKL